MTKQVVLHQLATVLLVIGIKFGESFPTIRAVQGRSSRSSSSNGVFAVNSASLSYEATAPFPSTDEQTAHNKALDDLGIHMPFGLRETLSKNLCTIPKRFWILDNSGSMAILDGHQILTARSSDCCTRWQEVQETVNCQAQLAASLAAPTDFRLLNPPKGLNGLWKGPQKFRVGYGHATRKDTQRAKAIMKKTEPKGSTPLASCIREVEREIRQMAPQLEATGQKVCLVLATDGCNYNTQNIGASHNHESEEEKNHELLEALESLQGLPVCVVIRLCTDYAPLVDFYNNLDTKLDLDLDVIDDHKAEALEVKQVNPWLNYGLVLHRLREMGQDNRLFDLIDERALTKQEIRDFCVLLFGHADRLSAEDWPAFIGEVDQIQLAERPQWNPVTKAMAPWIDVEELAMLDDEDDFVMLGEVDVLSLEDA